MMNVVSKMEDFRIFAPWVRIIKGENRREQVNVLLRSIGVPILAFILFLGLWDSAAKSVVTSLATTSHPHLKKQLNYLCLI